jgi:hypothetical protein
MAGRPNFKKLLRMLNEEHAEYLIVGGYAVMKYTEPRFQFTHAWQNRATGIFLGFLCILFPSATLFSTREQRAAAATSSN